MFKGELPYLLGYMLALGYLVGLAFRDGYYYQTLGTISFASSPSSILTTLYTNFFGLLPVVLAYSLSIGWSLATESLAPATTLAARQEWAWPLLLLVATALTTQGVSRVSIFFLDGMRLPSLQYTYVLGPLLGVISGILVAITTRVMTNAAAGQFMETAMNAGAMLLGLASLLVLVMLQGRASAILHGSIQSGWPAAEIELTDGRKWTGRLLTPDLARYYLLVAGNDDEPNLAVKILEPESVKSVTFPCAPRPYDELRRQLERSRAIRESANETV